MFHCIGDACNYFAGTINLRELKILHNRGIESRLITIILFCVRIWILLTVNAHDVSSEVSETYAAALDKFLLLLMLHMKSDSLNDSIHNHIDCIGYNPWLAFGY